MSTLLAIAWERPWALWLLAIPVALLLAALRRPRAELRATSDLESWRSVAASRGGGLPRTPRRVPVSLVLAALSCALAALAAAGPRAGDRTLRWTAVLDTSPSMHLPIGDSVAPTRLERAVAMARELAAREGAELAWIAPPHDLTPRGEPRDVWFRRDPPPDVRFEAWDVPGALWVTDRAPAESPREAGFVASGGQAISGPVAFDADSTISWDGEHLQRTPARPFPTAVERSGPALTAPLDRVLRAWADARGLTIVSASIEPTALHVAVHAAGPMANPARRVEAGRDGWSAAGIVRGAAPLYDTDGDLEVWLASGGEPLVTAGIGRVRVAWMPAEEPSGDPTAFAVSWAKLFDACTRQPDVTPLDERQAAGEPRSVPPRSRAREREHAPREWILAALATALALCALLLRRTRA